MPQNDLEIRMENVEQTVAGLAGLPQQVQDLSTQFLQLREEVRADISGVRDEMHGLRDDLRSEMHGIRDELRGEMHDIRGDLRGEMHDIRDELRGEMHGIEDKLTVKMHEMREELVAKIDGCRDELREDMASMHRGLAQIIMANHAQTLSLHEDLVGRIKLLGEQSTRADEPRAPDDSQ